MRYRILTVIMALAVAFIFTAHTSAVAGTTVIKVEAESGGAVNDTVNNTLNQNGALFWNGTDWVVNDSYAHMFFTDLVTGERLKLYTTYEMNSYPNQAVPGTNYTVVKRTYIYSVPGKAGNPNTYTYEAVEFEVVYNDPVTSKTQKTVLRSRGTGNGTASPYFNCYIEDIDANGDLISVTAVKGDPVWFTYANLAEALNATSDTIGRRGELSIAYYPTVTFDYFWLDIGGGSDMGGLTYHFHTSDLAPSAVAVENLGSSFVRDFSVQFHDDALGNLIELHFLPEIVSETITAPSIPTLNEWGMIILTLLMAGMAYFRLKQKRAVL